MSFPHTRQAPSGPASPPPISTPVAGVGNDFAALREQGERWAISSCVESGRPHNLAQEATAFLDKGDAPSLIRYQPTANEGGRASGRRLIGLQCGLSRHGDSECGCTAALPITTAAHENHNCRQCDESRSHADP
jgi:hypothetical protein